MAYSYGLSPSIPAIPTLYHVLNPDAPDRTPLGPIICRPKTEADVPEAGRLLTKVFRYNPVDLIRFSGSTNDEHLRFCEALVRDSLGRASYRSYVAVDTNNNKIQGYLSWSQVGMGEEDAQDTPAPYLPPGADKFPNDAYSDTIATWKQGLQDEYGGYYLGGELAVVPVIRNRGVAAALCLVLAKAAKGTGHRVFFITTYNAVPFYERFCLLHGYDVKMCGPPVYIDKALTCGHYMFEMEMARPKRPPEPVEKRYREYSP